MSISPLAARTVWPRRSSTANEASMSQTVPPAPRRPPSRRRRLNGCRKEKQRGGRPALPGARSTISSPSKLRLRVRNRLLVETQGGDECLLRDLDAANVLHALFALFLALEQLSFAADIAAVALGQHVLALGLHGLPGDDAPADSGLDGDVEHLSRDQLAQPGRHLASVLCGLVTVHDRAEGVDGDGVQQDVDLDEVGRDVTRRLVVERGVPLGAPLELVEEV